jgi:hypothetical protein
MAMKKRISTEVFGLSFLDIISCGFAAMLSLLLLAKNKDDKLIIIEPTIIDNSLPLDPLIEINMTLSEQFYELKNEKLALETRLASIDSTIDSTTESLDSIVEQVSLAQPIESSGSMDSIFSGGVPVGERNIIFIIDTSGSMQLFWTEVLNTLDNILRSHPKVDGLQIMSDNGEYLINGYSGGFIPDTEAARQRAFEKIRSWAPLSTSSPAEGLEEALRTYARKTNSLAIYVFGDDFSGESYDEVLSVIDRWNVDQNGNRLATIHGIGFPWGLGERYATLMREVAYRNKGVFLGM